MGQPSQNTNESLNRGVRICEKIFLRFHMLWLSEPEVLVTWVKGCLEGRSALKFQMVTYPGERIPGLSPFAVSLDFKMG